MRVDKHPEEDPGEAEEVVAGWAMQIATVQDVPQFLIRINNSGAPRILNAGGGD
jgi:hypothetical protein